ncbi:MAG: type IV toxin-antitoxin system AbiEi family antitoxin [Candidatus Thermoplasmatota archaeon]
MHKKNYLTREEQILFSTIKKTDIINNSHIQKIFPKYPPKKINKICHKLMKKGYLTSIKRGLYLINETPSQKPIIKNPFKIAQHLTQGYIGFSSALRIYDLTSYEPFTIFIINPKKSQEIKIGNYLFKTVSMGKKATGITYYKNLYTSNLEKTFFDCFYKPQYAGGYQEIINALNNTNKIKWQKLLQYFKKFASKSLFQRTGYILDLMNQKKMIKPPKYFLETFKKNIGNKTRLLPTKKSKGQYIKKWKLLDNIGKKTLLSEG